MAMEIENSLNEEDYDLGEEMLTENNQMEDQDDAELLEINATPTNEDEDTRDAL